jgi:hypothetical protein
VIANSEAVAKKSVELATATASVRSRWNGTIGSAACRSRTTKAAAATTVVAIRATI